MTKLTEEKFCDFLERCWKDSPTHSIKVSKGTKSIRPNTPDGQYFRVSSLLQCRKGSCWEGKNYEETEKKLSELSEKLRDAIETRNQPATEEAFCQIYTWGGMSCKGNISGTMFKKWSANNQLAQKIEESVNIISTGDGLEKFDNDALFMNSGYTKVVSLASDPEKPLIIYDGRVGAALGHLVTLAMQKEGFDGVEEQLRFPWGRARTEGVNRNPSNEVIKFPNLFNMKSERHAQAMHDASRIACKVATNLSITPREFEAALFMWGYSVGEKNARQ